MRTPLIYALLAAAANLAGAAAITWRAKWSDRALEDLVAASAGFMVAVTLGELVPEAVERAGGAAGAIMLAGFLLVHFTQHTLAKHFHFGEEIHAVSRAVSVSALGGLLLHTFVDGVAISSGYAVSPALGALVFGAILMHKLPEGLAISSMFLAAGARRRVAFAAAAALGVATILGVLLTEQIAALGAWGLPLAAGVTLYVGASNLVPEVQRAGGWRAALWFFGGCAMFLAAQAASGA